jgi:uncharacterized membrane protein (TIGR02234 family)
MMRIGQLALLLAAGALWLASRMAWVTVSSSNGLGQPQTATLTGGKWSTALVPLALMLLAAVLKSTVGPRWQQRVLAVIVGAMSAVMAYLAISQWVVPDVEVRAAGLADVPVADLVIERHYWGAIITLIAAVLTLSGAVLFMRAPAKQASDEEKYEAPARRREAARRHATAGKDMSERMIWDALDEGRDPTKPDSEAR